MANLLIPYSSFPPGSAIVGDYIKFSDSPLSAMYDGTNWNFFYEGNPCVLPLSSYTLDNAPTVVYNNNNGYLYLTCQDTVATRSVINNTIPLSAPYTVTIGVKHTYDANMVNNNVTAFVSGLGLCLGSASKQYQTFDILGTVNSGVLEGLLQINNFNSAISFSSNVLSVIDLSFMFTIGHKVYYQVENDGTNLIWRMGIDLNNLNTVYTASVTSFLSGGPTSFGIEMFTNSSNLEAVIFHMEVS